MPWISCRDTAGRLSGLAAYDERAAANPSMRTRNTRRSKRRGRERGEVMERDYVRAGGNREILDLSSFRAVWSEQAAIHFATRLSITSSHERSSEPRFGRPSWGGADRGGL